MKIFTEFHLSTGLYHLMCESHGRAATAGPRILRGGIWPSVRWSHETEEAAEKDAAKLRAYLDALPAMRKTKKKSTDKSAYD